MIKRCDHCVPPYCERVADCILRWRDAEEAPVLKVQRWPVLLMPHTRARAGQVAEWTSGALAGRLARCDVDVGQIRDLWNRSGDLGLEAYAHTTYSHTETAPRARVVFPLTTPVSAEQWREVWSAGSRWASSWGAVVDKACKDPSRLYYLPSAPKERRALYRFGRWEGARLPWRRLLVDYPAPKPPEHVPIPSLTSNGIAPKYRDSEDRRTSAYHAATLRGILQDLHGTPKGQRNPAIYRAGCRLGRLVQQGHLPISQVEQELIAYVRSMPGADRRDITTATRAIRVGLEDTT